MLQEDRHRQIQVGMSAMESSVAHRKIAIDIPLLTANQTQLGSRPKFNVAGVISPLIDICTASNLSRVFADNVT